MHVHNQLSFYSCSNFQSGMTNNRIELRNICEGDIVNHSILLIKGAVHGERCSAEENLEVQLNGATPKNYLISPLHTSGKFKILLDLSQFETKDTVNDNNESKLRLLLRYHSVVCALEFEYKTNTNNKYRLQPLLIVCSDEDANNVVEVAQYKSERIANALQKIDLNLCLVQSVYAEKLHEAGFGRHCFTLNGPCCIFRSRLTCAEAWARPEESLWQYFAEELLNSTTWGHNPLLKFVAFIACTKYEGTAVAASGDFSYANIRKHLKAHAALGGGGLALFGSAYFYAWPLHFSEIIDCFRNDSKVQPTLEPDDSNYRRTHGGVYATTLGAVCHELGHIFDLGHTSDGVMGSGFDYINRVFTVDNLTENLPTRLIQQQNPEQKNESPLSRFTQLKRTPAVISFLDRYHEQKTNDSFYFTRNCAVILAHHKWLNNPCDNSFSSVKEEEHTFEDIQLNTSTNLIISQQQPLKIVEVRCKKSSLVAYFYEFQNSTDTQVEKAVFNFELPSEVLALRTTHFIFVLTIDGQAKCLHFDK